MRPAMPGDAQEVWVRTDEAEDIAGSVRHALRCVRHIAEDEQACKWMALALHSALQGACVCHLTTSFAPVGAVEGRNAAEWIAYIDRSLTDSEVVPPRTRLMALPSLLKAVRNPHSAGDRSNDVGIAISDAELQRLTRLRHASP